MLNASAVSLPEVDALVMSTDHQAHAFGLAVEAPVFKESPRVERSVVRSNVQPYEAVGRVTKRPVAEAPVLGKERHPSKLVQQGNDVRVFSAQTGHLAANSSERNSPRLEEQRLIPGKVFVQQVQTAASSAPFRAVRRAGR